MMVDGYRVAGTTDDVTTCDQCGREDLRMTVRLVIVKGDVEDGELFVGSECATRFPAPGRSAGLAPRFLRRRLRRTGSVSLGGNRRGRCLTISCRTGRTRSSSGRPSCTSPLTSGGRSSTWRAAVIFSPTSGGVWRSCKPRRRSERTPGGVILRGFSCVSDLCGATQPCYGWYQQQQNSGYGRYPNEPLHPGYGHGPLRRDRQDVRDHGGPGDG